MLPQLYWLCSVFSQWLPALQRPNPSAIVFTEPKEAGIDYELQGEYVGEHESDEGKRKIAVQVLALGDTKFRCIAYVGGLPGDGWSRGGERHSWRRRAEKRSGSVQFRRS